MQKICNTQLITIFIAGDYAHAKHVCREFCMSGLCVTVEPTEFVYKGGAEPGVRVGLINYPRYPVEPEKLLATAFELAVQLRMRLCQHSFSVVTPTETFWDSVRED